MTTTLSPLDLASVRKQFPGLARTQGGRPVVFAEAHRAAADFLGGDASECVFGQNMTTLSFLLSRSVARTLSPGDELLLSRLDHDANIAPWLTVAEETGAVTRSSSGHRALLRGTQYTP